MNTNVVIEIYTIEDLDDMRLDDTETYILMNNLDFQDDGSYSNPSNKNDFITGSGWSSIGTSSSRFFIAFDGGGFEIKNLFISASSDLDVGLFGYDDIGEGQYITDISLVDVDIVGGGRVGALIGSSTEVIITKCKVSGEVEGDITVGGLVGSNTSDISNCHSSCNVEATGSGNTDAGGFVGFSSTSTILNCYATGNVVSTSSRNGGFAGNLGFEGVVDKCYSSGTVTGGSDTNGFSGGALTSFGGGATNCFWNVNTSGIGSSGDDNVGATGKTSVEMRSIGTFNDTATTGLDVAWDIVNVAYDVTNPSNVWNIVDTNSFPFLSWQDAIPTPPPGSFVGVKIGGVFEQKPLMIKKSGVFEQVGAKQVGGWA